MGEVVKSVIQRCVPCVRVQAGFKDPQVELQPLPIRGIGYRWGVDFAGPLPTTKRRNKYVLVMIEHFTKWVELLALPNKTSDLTARALLEGVLERFWDQQRY